MKLAVVRGKFLNQYEMQLFYPLAGRYDITAFGSLTSYHDKFPFPVVKLLSPMDLPEFSYKMPILNRIFTDAHVLWGLEEKLRGFDMVHSAETYFYYTKQCLEAKKRGYVKKVVATVLENIPYNNEGIWGRKELKARARNELDHIIALTEKAKTVLLQEGADERKITVMPHGIDSRRFRPRKEFIQELGRKEKREFTIMFAGRLEEYKGVFDFIDAAKELLEINELNDYRLKFLVVGEGSEKQKLLHEVNKYNLGKLVQFEIANYQQMPDIYMKADIFVAPSKPTLTYDEQYCTVLLEAQATGLPIVTTATGGIPENIGDAGIVVTPGRSDELANALKKLLLQPKLRVTYSRLARERAEKVHDIRVVSKRLARVYEQIWAE